MINTLDVTKNQTSKFRTRKWAEINDESREAYIMIKIIKIITINLKHQW